LAETPFDPNAFARRLGTRVLGRAHEVHAAVGSTNDEAWEAHGRGAPHGTVVIAAVQTRGRGRAGRRWETPRGGIAISLLLSEGCAARPLHVIPLAAGLALAESFEALGLTPSLKWPNDVLIGGRKVSGILAEQRGAGARSTVVLGVGVNVAQRVEDLVAAAHDPHAVPATSLAVEGVTASREEVAAGFLTAFEPWWEALAERGADPVLDAWRGRARFWGETVRVRGAGGVMHGVARGLDAHGRLVLDVDGAPVAVIAGDLELPGAGA